jgi:AraC-like DNA-binding protein
MGAGAYVLVNRTRVQDFESLRESVPASTSEVMQLEKGRMRGLLTRISVGEFSVTSGSFSLGIRSQGILSERKLTLVMLLDTSGTVSTLGDDMRPGDIGISPPGVEHCVRYYGGGSFAAVSVGTTEFLSFLKDEPRLNDPKIWRNRIFLRAPPNVATSAERRMNKIISWMSEHGHEVSVDAADFWKRSLLELMTRGIMNASVLNNDLRTPSASALVHRIEDYVDAAGTRPMHLSEICNEFGVSRRSLHRAFDEIIGVSPATFLRQKRLCSVHAILRDSDPAKVTVAEVAAHQGFTELGRFSHYYHSLFGEYPSETLRDHRRRIWSGAGQPGLNAPQAPA